MFKRFLGVAACATFISGGVGADQSPYSDEFGAAVRAYLLDHPTVMLEVFAKLQDLEEQEAHKAALELIGAHEAALFQSKAPRMGAADGQYIVAEFFDYACGFCKQALNEVDGALAGRDDITVVLIELPILGSNSDLAARVGMALREAEGDEAYLSYHRALMSHPERLDADLVEDVVGGLGFDFASLEEAGRQPSISAELRANRQLAQALGINGTPGFVFRDEIVAGLVRTSALVEKLERGGR